MIKAVRGTRDLLPPDTALWNFVEGSTPKSNQGLDEELKNAEAAP